MIVQTKERMNMGITYEQLKAVSDNIEKVPIKGKKYAEVSSRVKAFRQLCPDGTISTDILSLENGVVTMKATVIDGEGHVLGTGLAQEKESSSFINKTSFIENCETSAVGRALGFAGIGVDGSMASAEEVANAIINQNKGEAENEQWIQKGADTLDATKIKSLKSVCKNHKMPEEQLAKKYGKTKIEELTITDYADFAKTGEAFMKKWDEANA